MKFQGVLVTDYEEIDNLKNWHHIVKEDGDSVAAATEYALKQGTVDMSMIPWTVDGFVSAAAAAVRNDRIDESRINESAMRVLRLKQQLGLFDTEMTFDNAGPLTDKDDQALEMAKDSLVLTKNAPNLLPLRADSEGLKLLVTGPTSNSRVSQTGGWTVTWQGPPSEDSFATGSTVYEAFLQEVGRGLFSEVVHRCGTDILGAECNETVAGGGHRSLGFLDDLSDIGSDIGHGISEGIDGVGKGINSVGDWVGWSGHSSDKEHGSIQRAIDAAVDVDLVLICVGEEAYAEKPGDVRSAYLPFGQLQLVQQLRDTYSDKPIILVYFGGRPRLLDNAPYLANAVIVGFLPGPHAGRAVVDLVSGKYSPSGRLPITYPAFSDGGGVPYLHTMSDQCTNGTGALPHLVYEPCAVQWKFGHGLSYVNFVYSNLQVGGDVQSIVTVRVDVVNTGTIVAAETVMVFTFDDSRMTTPEYKRLRAAKKVLLQPNQKNTVTLDITSEDFKFIGPHDDHHFILDPTMSFWVGIGSDTDCRSNSTSSLCARVEGSKGNNNFVPPACQAACDLWMNDESHSCGSQFEHASLDCLKLCGEANNWPVHSASVGTEGWGWNYVNCLESVIWGFQQQNNTVDCRKMTALCRDVFVSEKLNEFGLGKGSVKQSTSSPELCSPKSCPSSQEAQTSGCATAQFRSGPAAEFAGLSGLVAVIIIALFMRGIIRPLTQKGPQPSADELHFPAVEMFSFSPMNVTEAVAAPDENQGSTLGLPSKPLDLLKRIEIHKQQEFSSVPTFHS